MTTPTSPKWKKRDDEAEKNDQAKADKAKAETKPIKAPSANRVTTVGQFNAEHKEERIKQRAAHMERQRLINGKPPKPFAGDTTSEYAKAYYGPNPVVRGTSKRHGEPPWPINGHEDNRPASREHGSVYMDPTTRPPSPSVYAGMLNKWRGFSGGSATEPRSTSSEGKAVVLALVMLAGASTDERDEPNAAGAKQRLLEYCDAIPCYQARKMIEKLF